MLDSYRAEHSCIAFLTDLEDKKTFVKHTLGLEAKPNPIAKRGWGSLRRRRR